MLFGGTGLADDNGVFVFSQRQQQMLKEPENPSSVRTLADIYLDAGLYEESFTAYGRAQAIALTVRNQDEVQKAEEGLRFVISLQKDLERGA